MNRMDPTMSTTTTTTTSTNKGMVGGGDHNRAKNVKNIAKRTVNELASCFGVAPGRNNSNVPFEEKLNKLRNRYRNKEPDVHLAIVEVCKQKIQNSKSQEENNNYNGRGGRGRDDTVYKSVRQGGSRTVQPPAAAARSIYNRNYVDDEEDLFQEYRDTNDDDEDLFQDAEDEEELSSAEERVASMEARISEYRAQKDAERKAEERECRDKERKTDENLCTYKALKKRAEVILDEYKKCKEARDELLEVYYCYQKLLKGLKVDIEKGVCAEGKPILKNLNASGFSSQDNILCCIFECPMVSGEGSSE